MALQTNQGKKKLYFSKVVFSLHTYTFLITDLKMFVVGIGTLP